MKIILDTVSLPHLSLSQMYETNVEWQFKPNRNNRAHISLFAETVHYCKCSMQEI